MKKTALKGVSSTEVGILIAISVVVVALGTMTFYNNIKNTAMTGKFNQTAAGGSSLNYTAENRDYAASQIEVQTMGAQGLEMLRRKANNMAIEIIEATNAKDKANDIAYLTKALEIITGETNVCAYMKEDTDKHCRDFTIDKYATSVSGSSLNIIVHNARPICDSSSTEPCQNGPVSVIPPQGPLALTASVIDAISSTVYTDSQGYPTATNAEKIDALIALTKAVYYDIDKNIALVDIDLKGDIKANTSGIKDIRIAEALENLESRVQGFFKECISDYGMPAKDCSNGDFSVKMQDKVYFDNWLNSLTNSLSGASLTRDEAAEIIDKAFADKEIRRILERDTLDRAVKEDDEFYPESASTLINELCEYAIGSSCGYVPAKASHTANVVAENPFLSFCYDAYNNVIDFCVDHMSNVGVAYAQAAVGAAQEFVQGCDDIYNVWQSDEPTVDKVIDTCDRTQSMIVSVRNVAHDGVEIARDIVNDVYENKPVTKAVANAALTVVDVTVKAVTVVAEVAVKTVEVATKAVKAVGNFFKKLFSW